MKENLSDIVSRFGVDAVDSQIKPLGDGLINDTYIVSVPEKDYILQRINHNIFKDVDMLQSNIEAVTSHIREELTKNNTSEINRHCLRFLPLKDSPKTYFFDGSSYWRMMDFISGSKTVAQVNPETSEITGRAFGDFQKMLATLDKPLGETIPDFHNMEFRLDQFKEAIENDAVGRVDECEELIDALMKRSDRMTAAEHLYREGKLPKRACHCDTKVNNILFDKVSGEVLCVIDLDTVMPSFIFSDFGDFLRTAANPEPEDSPEFDKIDFDMDIFKAFTRGYLSSAKGFLTPIEIEMLPYAALLFPYMQAVRFLTDYLNGDTYYKIQYPLHNLVRTKAQLRLLEKAEEKEPEMILYINSLI